MPIRSNDFTPPLATWRANVGTAVAPTKSTRGCNSDQRCAKDTLAEWLRRRPAKPMGSPRVGSNPTGVAFAQALPVGKCNGRARRRTRNCAKTTTLPRAHTHTRGGTRTHNLLLRGEAPYPLGHTGLLGIAARLGSGRATVWRSQDVTELHHCCAARAAKKRLAALLAPQTARRAQEGLCRPGGG